MNTIQSEIDKLDGQDCYVLYSNSYAYESDYVFSKEVNTYSEPNL